jgi:hypothetical protein
MEYDHTLGRYSIWKIFNGVATEISFFDTSPLGDGLYTFRAEFVMLGVDPSDGVSLKQFMNGVLRANKTVSDLWTPDVHFSGLALPNDESPGTFNVDDFELRENILAKAGTETADVSLTEVGTKTVLSLKSGTDTDTDVSLTEAGSLEIAVLKTGTDADADVSLTESGAIVSTVDLLFKVGLISDVEPSLIQTHWDANLFLIPTLSGVSSVSGYVLDEALGELVIEHLNLEDQEFYGLLGFHLSSMFASALDQRGAQRVYLICSRESGDRAAFRGVLKSPVGSFPMTQDAPSHEVIGSSVYRHLDVGMFSWPPSLGGSDKIRSGNVIQHPDSDDLDAFKGVEIQGISEGTTFPDIRISSVEFLPVDDGFFALMGIKSTNAAALQAGEVMVMDKINNPSGGYLIKQSEDKSSELDVNDVGSVTPMAILGDGLILQPQVANLISVVIDAYNAGDDQGATGEELEFEMFIDYEPRFLFF